MKLDPNAPAFPIASQIHTHDSYSGRREPTQEEFTPGLTIRAEIASRVLAGFAGDDQWNICKPQAIADCAVQWADALIAALNEEKP